MGASSADRFNLPSVPVAFINMPVAATTTVYANCCVMVIDGTGGVLLANDTSNGIFVGITRQGAVNSGSLGAKTVEVIPKAQLGAIEISATSPTDAWNGKLVYFVDDNSVALIGTTTYDVVCGRVLYVSKTGTSGKVVVDVTDTNATVHA